MASVTMKIYFGSIKVKSNATANGGEVERTLWSKDRAHNVKVKQSNLPTDPGAYSMVGAASDLDIESVVDADVVRNKYLEVKVNLKDDEVNHPVYEERRLRIPFPRCY